MYAHKIIEQDSWLTQFTVQVLCDGAVVQTARVYWDAEDNMVLDFGDENPTDEQIRAHLQIWHNVQDAFVAEVDDLMGGL